MKLNKKFYLEIDDVLQYYKEKEFFDYTYKSLEQFIGIFNDYIVFIINKFYSNFKEEKKDNFIKKGRSLFSNVKSVFSFNYTETYLNFYIDPGLETVKSLNDDYKFNLQSLHGQANKAWKNEFENLNIVLGVNDIDPLLKNHKLFQFTKYFQKLHKGTEYLFLDEIIKSSQRSTKGMMSYTFYFWGHSLDISDKDYINDVFKVVTNTSSKIKIFYHSISGKAEQLKNLLNIIDKNTIESMMKNETLSFIASTPENLFEEL